MSIDWLSYLHVYFDNKIQFNSIQKNVDVYITLFYYTVGESSSFIIAIVLTYYACHIMYRTLVVSEHQELLTNTAKD